MEYSLILMNAFFDISSSFLPQCFRENLIFIVICSVLIFIRFLRSLFRMFAMRFIQLRDLFLHKKSQSYLIFTCLQLIMH